MREIKEIEPYTPEQQGYKNASKDCPKCHGPLYFGSVRCTDGMPGCCVNHFGYVCWKCGAQFQ